MKNPIPQSDHYDGHRFHNPSGAKPKSLFSVIKWKLSSRKKPWPAWVENTHLPQPVATTRDDEVVVTFINHATFLIQTAGLNILTDPVFSRRISPFKHLGPKRVHQPGLDFEQLPRIDLVFVSHNHYDHLDLPTIKKLEHAFHPQFISPLGNGKTLKKAGVKKIIETDWWQTVAFHGAELITVPAQHWSARGLHDRNRSLWGGLVVQTGKKSIYFAGDTGYGSHFKEICKRLGEMDLALLPIGAYEPRWFMRDHHMSPEDAVHAHLDLAAQLSIGMHFGTFQLTDEGLDEPVQDLESALRKYKVKQFTVLNVGETRRIISKA